MTSTREHVHEESFARPPAVVFALLIRPSAIRRWWSASQAIVLPRSGGFWAVTWGENEDEPDYVTAATIRVLDPPRRMLLTNFRYHATTGPLPFEAEFETEFSVIPEEGGCRLTAVQRGFPVGPEADDYYAACQRGWADTFAGIRSYLNLSVPM